MPFFAPRVFTVNFDDVRILHISSAKTFGGGERHLVDLTRDLQTRGHEVFVGLRPTNEWQDRFDFLPPERLFHVSIRNSFGMFSTNRISRFLAREKIDIIHAHVARDYLAASIAARRAKGVKLVLTRHVMFPTKPFHRLATRNVDAAIAVSPAVAGQLAKIFPKEKVNIITNGITMDTPSGDGDAFRSFHDIPADAPLVVTLGELRPLKGQRDLVLAAHEIVKTIPDCRFVVAGRDHTLDKKFRRELKRLTKVLGMEDNFLWLDWLDYLAADGRRGYLCVAVAFRELWARDPRCDGGRRSGRCHGDRWRQGIDERHECAGPDPRPTGTSREDPLVSRGRRKAASPR